MRWTLWLLPALGVAQLAYAALAKPAWLDMGLAFILLNAYLIAFLVTYAFSCCGWCGYGEGGCGCEHCDGCRSGTCCGECGCGKDRGHGHGEGHEGHSH